MPNSDAACQCWARQKLRGQKAPTAARARLCQPEGRVAFATLASVACPDLVDGYAE